ncbi:MAG: hypothetical protein RTU30_02705 [Candidatus Thorarchaeota archaeon]
MSENKKVIIDIEETEKTVIGELSELERIETSGVLSVNNVSEQSRIWSVRVLLGDSRKATNIPEESLPAGEVDTGSKWETDYDVTVSAPILTLTEVFDTCSTEASEDPHWAYAFGKDNPVKITIRVKNEADSQLDNIILNKTIPPELSNVMVDSTSSGVAEYDEGTRQVVWKDFLVYPGEESTLVLTAKGIAEDVDSKNAGEVVVSYRGEGLQRSSLDPDMTALTEFLTGIETAETEPNQWECTLECSNESDLMIRLDKADVYLVPEAGGEKQKMIDESPSFELAPNQEWTSSFQIESKSPPKCTQEVTYTPMRDVTKRVLGTVEKVSQTVPVYKIDYTKIFDPPQVASFDKTPVEVTLEITNSGSAKLNELVIRDSLPDDVMPPKKEHISIWIRDTDYTGDFGFVVDPDDQDPEKPHTLTFTLTDLKDTVGELKLGERVKINYAIMAWRSRPEKEYPSPIHCSANISPPGLPTEVASDPDGHKIGIVYKKRRISVKKAINRGSSPGEYSVMIVAENKGEVTVENVVVTDWIPDGFDYVTTEPMEEEPALKPVDDGMSLVWSWTRMNPGDRKKITVKVQGEGEYERREPEVTSD